MDIWDATASEVVASTPFFAQDAVLSTVAPVTAGEHWVVVDDTLRFGGTPEYTLTIEAPEAMTNDTCATAADLADADVGTEVTEGDPTRKIIEGWTAAANDAAYMSQPPGPTNMCIETPPPPMGQQATPLAETGPDVIYTATVPAGQRFSARLDSDFDGALYLVTDCAQFQTTCVAGADANALGESITYVNETGAPQNLFLYVDTTDQYGGFFSLLTDTNAECADSGDCAQLGDFCDNFRCTDPAPGGTRVNANINAGAPVPIADGGMCMPKMPMPGEATEATFAVAGATGTVSGVHVFVEATHTYSGDIVLELVAPDGTTTVPLKAFDIGDGTADVSTVYPDQTPAAGDLAAFNGLDPNGTWTLRATDSCMQDTGTLNRAVLLLETTP